MAELEDSVRRLEMAEELAVFFVEQLKMKLDVNGFVKLDFKDQLVAIAERTETSQDFVKFLTDNESLTDLILVDNVPLSAMINDQTIAQYLLDNNLTNMDINVV